MRLDVGAVSAALPRYEVGGELGRGGWGVVLEGRHRQLGREVAIKQLPQAFAADPAVRARFLAEARLLASLDHPHIVPVYDFVEHEGLCLLVMEKLSGGTVWDRFTGSGMVAEASCVVVLAACAGLHAAHRAGILHRDVKPENLMFSAAQTLKITDFGIAKMLGGPKTMATSAGDVLGTPAYMAPEQAQGLELGPATDVYAVGVLLYELLSGRLPFPDEAEPLSMLYRRVHESPEPLLRAAPEVPSPLAEVTMRALATSPEDRYPTSEALGVAVAEAATAAWGSGWIERADIALLASGPILAAVERASTPSERVDHPRLATTVAARPVRAAATATARVPVALALDPDVELVPVEEVLDRPAPPTAKVATALALLLLCLVVAFVGLGTPSRAGTLGRGTVTVNGVDPAIGQVVPADLERPVTVAGTAADATGVRLSFTVAGIPLGSARSETVPGPDGRFSAQVDASGSRYLVAGRATAELTLEGPDPGPLRQAFAVRSTQPPLLTAPGAAGLGLALFAIAYAESLLRSLRRGRKRVSGTAGMVTVGAVFGLAAVTFAWLVAAREPVPATVGACALFGSGAGLAAAQAAIIASHRRRAARAGRSGKARS